MTTTTPNATTAALLSAQAIGGLDGVNAYLQLQQDIAARKQTAVQAALARAQGRNAPQAALDQTAASVGQPYDQAALMNTQQATNYEADMARRNSRWNEYAHNVESARGLVADEAAGKASVIDAQTKAQLALLEAQRRASAAASARSSSSGGGGSGAKQLTKAELSAYLGSTAAQNLNNNIGKAVQAHQSALGQVGTAGKGVKAVRSSALAEAQRRTTGDAYRRMMQAEANDARNQLAPIKKQIPAALTAATDTVRMVPATEPSFQDRRGMDWASAANMYPNLPKPGSMQAGEPILASEAAKQALAQLYKDKTALETQAQGKTNVGGVQNALLKNDPKAAEAKALMDQALKNLQEAGNGVGAAQDSMIDPQALVAEMARVAQTDPNLMGRFSPFDLAEVLTPGPQMGESADDYMRRLQGWGPTGPQTKKVEAAQQQYGDQQTAAVDQQKQQINYQYGIDIDKIASAAGMPWDQAATILTQDSTVSAAIQNYEELRTQAADQTELDDAVWSILQQMDSRQAAVFNAYLGL